MKTVCIIQARRGSSRLPDKILKPIAGKAVLEHVIERTSLIDGVDEVMCATVSDDFNKPVLKLADKAGASQFAGSEHDVLDRYFQAAVSAEAEIVMRVTADCPLLDPYVCAEAVALVKNGLADYGAVAGSWPHGMDCEVFTFELLEKTHKSTELPEYREHVTLWMKGHSDIRQRMVNPPCDDLRNDNRWVVDYPEDYKFLQKLADLAPNGQLPMRWQDTLAIIENHPHLRDINRHCEKLWEDANRPIYNLADKQR